LAVFGEREKKRTKAWKAEKKYDNRPIIALKN